MAIPIMLPSSEDDDFCSLETLLEQLLVTVRQMLVVRRQQQIMRNLPVRQRTPTGSPVRTPSTPASPMPSAVPEVATMQHPRLPLPDVVPDFGDCEVPRSRKTPVPQTITRQVEPPSIWVQTGAELRHIADVFKTERCLIDVNQNLVDKSARLKEASLLSMLRPALNGPIWTTVAFLLGWRLLARTR